MISYDIYYTDDIEHPEGEVDPLLFRCEAKDEAHALEQFQDAEPAAAVAIYIIPTV